MIKSNLSELLAKRGKTVEELDEETAIPAATIRALISQDARLIAFDELEALCDYLQCTVGELLEHTSP